MKVSINKFEAAELLLKDDFANWSRAGALAMAEYWSQLEEECDIDLLFCPVAIRCDYSEYATKKEVEEAYSMSLEELREHTLVLDFDNGYIIGGF